MKIIFFGTPEYVIPIPEALKNAGHEIVAVVTQPTKPVGRKKILSPSPVAQWANSRGIQVFTSATAQQCSVAKAEIGVLAAYGRIIPKDIIELFPHGILNVHPSLLPKYRGASPVQATIMAGDKQTGVTIMKMDEKVDHGPIVDQFRDRVRVRDTSETLRERLFEQAANALPKILDDYLNGKTTLKEQDHNKVTFTTLIKKSDGLIEPQDIAAASQGDPLQAQRLERFIRAMSPWPIAWTNLQDGRKLKILKAHMDNNKLVLDEVQLESKKPVTWKQFKEGYPEAKF